MVRRCGDTVPASSRPHGHRTSALYPSALTRSEEKSTLCYRDELSAPSACVMRESRPNAQTEILQQILHKATVKLHSAWIVGIANGRRYLRRADW